MSRKAFRSSKWRGNDKLREKLQQKLQTYKQTDAWSFRNQTGECRFLLSVTSHRINMQSPAKPKHKRWSERTQHESCDMSQHASQHFFKTSGDWVSGTGGHCSRARGLGFTQLTHTNALTKRTGQQTTHSAVDSHGKQQQQKCKDWWKKWRNRRKDAPTIEAPRVRPAWVEACPRLALRLAGFR